ncbi:MAG: SWIM zinc finger family protein [bacterium]
MAKGNNLTHVLTKVALRRLAYGRSYDRGERYFQQGRVQSLSEFGGRLVARVSGADDYRVELWAEKGLAHSCTCPVGEDGLLCKHCVAAGLEWLDRREAGDALDSEDAGYEDEEMSRERLRGYLGGLDNRVLADLLMREAVRDPELAERLMLRARADRPGGLSAAYLRKNITAATRVHGPLWGRATTGFVERIHTVLEPVWALVDAGQGAEGMGLAEYALERVQKAAMQADDSDDGCMAGLLDKVAELHLAACRAARPDPRALALRLLGLAQHSEWELFSDAAERYREVLGDEGVAEFRRLAEAAWRRMKPVLKPGVNLDEQAVRRDALGRLLESAARAGGDIDDLASVMARDLSSPSRYLEIAEVYQGAGDADKALAWAEKGYAKRGKDWTYDTGLADFLFGEYLRRGRTSDAMNVAWGEFTDAPSSYGYRMLSERAGRAGQWPTWREEALEFLRERAAGELKQGKASAGPLGYGGGCARTLVEVLLSEGAADEAWTESVGARLDAELWVKLAEAREKGHPDDAVKVYQRHVEFLMAGLQGKRYEEAVRFLLRIARLLAAMGRRAQFEKYLEEFRAKYKRKWTLMQLLDSTAWPGQRVKRRGKAG